MRRLGRCLLLGGLVLFRLFSIFLGRWPVNALKNWHAGGRKSSLDFAKLKPIRNLPVVLQLQCGGCPTQGYVRARNREAARDVALAGGWFVAGHHAEAKLVPIWACPPHNPARTEFGA